MRKQCKLERRVLFVLLMLIGSLPSFAHNWTQSPYNTYKEDSWNDYAKDHAPKIVNGVYEISSPEELAYISNIVLTGTPDQRKEWLKASYRLTKDLDMSGHYWTPIGDHKDDRRFRGSFDGNGHTIKNLYIYKDGNYCGLFAAADQVFSIKNLVMDNWAIEGDSYVGLLIGITTDVSIGSIEQVYVYNGHLSTQWFGSKCLGGLIGELNRRSKVSISNSYVDCELPLNEGKICETIGGFIGKLYDSNKVTFTNCIAKTAGNNLYGSGRVDLYKFRGAFVGLANKNSRVSLVNCGVESSSDDINYINKSDEDCSIGLFVGALHSNLEGKADADAMDCFVMNTDGMKLALDGNRDEILFGRRAHSNICVSGLRSVLTQEHDINRSDAIAKMNMYGAHMGLGSSKNYMPLSSKDGCVISMGNETHVNKVTTVGLPEDMTLSPGNEAFMLCNVNANYKLQQVSDSWYMEDLTEKIKDKKRLGKYEFSGTPESEVGGQLAFKVSKRPVIVLDAPRYNLPRQRVELSWSVNVDGADMEKYWKKGAQWMIYRNGEKYDSLAMGKDLVWYDEKPLLGETSEYKVCLLNPNYFYEAEDNIIDGSGRVSCGTDIELSSKVSYNDDGVIVDKVKIPNSLAFDGCKVSLWKVICDTDGKKSKPSLVEGSTTTFAYKPHSDSDYLELTLKDNTGANACNKWEYYAQCEGFAEGSYFHGKTIKSTTDDIVPTDEPVEVEKFVASKGESASKITVEWKTKKMKEQILYTLYRKLYNISEAGKDKDSLTNWTKVTELTNAFTTNTYVDETLPGYVYKYRLLAYKPCDGSYSRNVPALDLTTIGYAASRGTIMGRITFGNSATVVKNVDVRIGSDASAMQSVGGTYAFKFKGKNDQLQLATGLNKNFWDGDWTLQFLYRPSDTEQANRLLTIPGRCAILAKSGSLFINDKELALPSAYNYNYVMLKHEKGTYSLGYAQTGQYDNWSVQVKDADMTAWMNKPAGAFDGDGIYFGKVNDTQNSFIGYLDEVRLWNKVLTATDVRNTYNRYLTGNEMGLMAYYTFDAGVAEYAFDNSHPGGIWNNHDTQLQQVGYPELKDDVVPDQSVLCYRGYTDDHGEYQIAGIPFIGEGTNYMVTPVYGTHQFQSASTRRYVSGQSLSHSDVNFIDKSSFRVPVKATYQYGNIPAEGLNVLVDGVVQTDVNQKTITTDENGEAVVNVPIGKHRLQLSANKHNMLNGGYACSVTSYGVNGETSYKSLPDAEGYYDFQSDLVAPMTFVDATLVRLVGRVAGGFEEASKPVGFHKGDGNLGAMKLKLSPMGGKNAAAFVYTKADGVSGPGDEIRLASNAGDSIATNTIYPCNERYVTVQTDSETGEYIALLPPITWKVADIRPVAKPEEIPFDMEKVNNVLSLDVCKQDSDQVYKETVVGGETVREAVGKPFKYCAKRNYIQYHQPKAIFTTPAKYLDNEADSLMLGTSFFNRTYTKEENGEIKTLKEKVPLWKEGKHDGTADSYVLGYPVFESGCEYFIDIYLSEEYTNYTTGKITRVPVKGALITINNKMASSYFKPTKSGGYEVVDIGTSTDSISTKAGFVNYSFTAGVPNLTEADHAWPMTIKYTVDEIDYTLDKPLKGIVLGAINRPGSEFVTAGPDVVDFVLRDPPGSNSTAYLERGSSITSSWSFSSTTETTMGHNKASEDGLALQEDVIIGGEKVEKVLENNKIDVNHTEYKLQNKSGYSHAWNLSYTFTDRVSTSSNAKYVGAMGDVYIGSSHNYTMATADALHLYPADKGGAVTETGQHFKVMQKEVNSISEKIGTTFMYAQYDIVYTVIPNLVDKRNSLVTKWVDDFSQVPTDNSSQDYLYYALKSSQKKQDWKEDEDYRAVAPSSSAKEVQDMMYAYCQWIEQWKKAIATEEEKKFRCLQDTETRHFSGTNFTQTTTSFDYGYLGNVTFGSGSPNSRSFKVSESSTGSTDMWQSQGSTSGTGIKSVIKTSKNAITTNASTAGGVYEVIARKASDSEGKTTTFGFNLADSDVGDDFSVSLYLPGQVQSRQTTKSSFKLFMPEPYMFFTKGGQSRNPWEKKQMSLYFKWNDQSVALDGGTESLDQPYIKFDNANIFNVPTGTVASATMTLANNSKGNTDYKNFIYTLRCLNLNEKDGLQVLVNGLPITNGITVQLPPNKAPKKYQVDFKQTRFDVANYDNLLFELKLTEDARDTISIHFEPRAPKPTFKVNGGSNIVNKNTAGKRLLFNLSGYSADYYLFGGIRLKYRKQGETLWNTQTTLVNDENLLTHNGKMPESNWRKLVDKADTVYFDMSKLLDGKYEVYAEAFSIAGRGKDDLVAGSDTVVVIKNTKAPDYFGKLLPADGYYSGTEEIGAEFTEPINGDLLTKDNIVVKAVLNDAEVTHKVGLHFDGNAPAHTISKLNMMARNATIAFWYKPVVGKKSCLFSQTVKNDKDQESLLALYYNEDASLTLKLGEETFASTNKQALSNGKPYDGWMYAVVTVDKTQDKIMVYNLYDTVSGDEALFIQANQINRLVGTGRASLYVGGSTTGEPCYAEMESMVIYDKAQPLATVAANMGKGLSNTRGLLAYWPMNENFGTVAKDRVRRCDLALSGTDNWYMPVNNYALKLNGKDQYMNINTSACPISKDEDYVLGIWFRTKGKTDRAMTIFSNGWGAAESTEQNKDNRLSISLNENGHILLSTAGHSYEMGTKRYDDNNWHYLSMNVQRDAYLTLAVDTLELSSKQAIAGNKLAGLENSKMTLGALRYIDGTTQKEIVKNYFEGEIDEVRLWNAHRTDKAVNEFFYTGLEGDEPGLVAYYPFESKEIIANQEKTLPSISDHVKTNSASNVYRAQMPELVGFTSTADTTALAQEATDAMGPKLRAAAVLSPIEMNYKLSNDKTKLLLEFPSTLAKSRIEGRNVHISLRYLEDLYGNRMEQPLEWSVYVKQADLHCYLRDSKLTQQVGNSSSTTMTLTNGKSSAMTWEVVSCPSWLKLGSMSGSLRPSDADEIKVEAVAGTPIGNYQETISIIDGDGITQNVPVELVVTGIRPDWKVDVKDNGTWMGIVGRLMIEDKYVSNEDDLVAVFDANGICHGLGSPKYDETMDTYFLQINILGGGLKNGAKLYFRVWDASTGLVYNEVHHQLGDKTGNSIEFVDNYVMGNFNQLLILNAKQTVRQLSSFAEGWTWMSTWVKPVDDAQKYFTYADVFGPIDDKITVVKAKVMPDNFRKLNIKPSDSYRVYANEACKVELSGKLISPEDVKISFSKVAEGNTRWYWIGYPLSKTMTLTEAFADFVPEKGDIVKSQKTFAIYNGKTWVGSLSYLEPGQGYMYGYTGQRNQTWSYPSDGKAYEQQAARMLLGTGVEEKHLFSNNPCKYGSNMTVVAKLEVDGMPADNYQVGAFVDGECRGWLKSDANGLVYLTVSGDADQKQISYRAYNPANGRVLAIQQSDTYMENGQVGTVDEPRLLSASDAEHFHLDIEPDYYENYAYVLATVLDTDGQMFAHDYELAAFDQAGKCCGISTANAKEKCYIPIYGKEGDSFTFKLWDKSSSQEYVLGGKVGYDSMQPIIPVNLYLLTTGIQGVKADADGKAKLYDINGVKYNRQNVRHGSIYIDKNKKVGIK